MRNPYFACENKNDAFAGAHQEEKSIKFIQHAPCSRKDVHGVFKTKRRFRCRSVYRIIVIDKSQSPAAGGVVVKYSKAVHTFMSLFVELIEKFTELIPLFFFAAVVDDILNPLLYLSTPRK